MSARRTSVWVGALMLATIAAWILRDLADIGGAGHSGAAEETGIEVSPPLQEASDESDSKRHPSGSNDGRAPAATPTRQVFGESGPVRITDIPKGRFLEQLLSHGAKTRAEILGKLGQLQIPLNDVGSLHLDANGSLFYACTFGDQAGHNHDHTRSEALLPGQSPDVGIEALQGNPPANAALLLHSRPGSANTVFLDFNGHTLTGTAWNTGPGGQPVYECLPYNIDDNRGVFGDRELRNIELIWERVSEAFRGFDIDVTTEAPAVFNNRTAHVVITHFRDANDVLMPVAGGVGGVAYVGTFGNSDFAEKYAVSLIYHLYQTTEETAAVIAHEVGHNMGLGHDGAPGKEYYPGHDYRFGWWSPVMGGGPGSIQQWSKGDYYGANNKQDDLAIIAGRVAYITDDHSNLASGASPIVANGSEVRAWGAIERTSDADAFSLTVDSGPVSLNVTPLFINNTETSQNLRSIEVAAELRDTNGGLVKRVDPIDSPVLAINAELAAGTYTLRIAGVGSGEPLSVNPSGFTAYGSLGSYYVQGTVTPPAGPVLPFIAKHPESRDAFATTEVSFEVVARGNPATSYQWQVSSDGGGTWTDLANELPFSGSTERVLWISGVSFDLHGARFRCVVSNVAGSATSNSAELKVRAPPFVVTQPVSQYTTTGGSATFSVVASGTMPLSYQWIKDGSEVPGASGASLTIADVSASNVGLYRVEIRNAHGFTSSDSVALGIDKPPEIVVQPVSKGVVPGTDTTLEITVIGSSPLNLQWHKGGVAIPGATGATLIFPDASEADSGSYTVTAVNAFGSVTSNQAILLVGSPPSISSQPASQTLVGGQSLTLSVTAQGAAPLGYQWKKNGVAIPGAAGATLVLGPALANHQAVYSVVVSNLVGSIESAPANIVVNIKPAFLVQPVPQLAVIGRAGTFTVVVTGRPAPDLQWRKDGVPIPGETSATLTIPNTSWDDEGTYTVEATNLVGSAVSVGASLTVFEPVEVLGSRVAAGGKHSLFVTEGGQLWAMGSNSHGQLGDGTVEDRLEPVLIAEGVSFVAAGRAHSLFVRDDGTLWAMGDNDYGQLGDGTTTQRTTPVQIADGVAVVATGDNHSLILKEDGTLWAMGWNISGALGDGTSIDRAFAVPVASGVTSIAAGYSYSLFVKEDATGWAMGSNSNGQLGIEGGSQYTSPVQIATGLASVACGSQHSLFLSLDGTLRASGSNGGGAIGDGTTDSRATPVVVATGIVSIGAGTSSSLFIKEDGTLWTMGSDYNGQLGRVGGDPTLPGMVAEGVLEAAMGELHMVFLGIGDTVWVTGENESGQLGDGRTVRRYVPYRIRPPSPPIIEVQPTDEYGRTGSIAKFSVEVDGALPLTFQWLKDGLEIPGATERELTVSDILPADLGTYRVVVTNELGSKPSNPVTLSWVDPVPIHGKTVAAGYGFSLFIRADGSLWGTGTFGQPGDGLPWQIASGVAAVAAGQSHALFLKSDGTLFAMGANDAGQLGDGTHDERPVPVQIAIDVASIATAWKSSAFVKTDGTLWVMGWNEFGPRESSDFPSLFATGVRSVSLGDNGGLFFRTNGTLWGWGSYPRTFIGQPPVNSYVRPAFLASDVVDVATRGSGHLLFVKSDGALYALGTNYDGELGDGTAEPIETPTLIATDVSSVAVGYQRSLFVKTDGSLWGMGLNYYGQLGMGTLYGSSVPVRIASSAAEITAGEGHTIYKALDGGIWATGTNDSGQLGDGKKTIRRTFYQVDPSAAPTFVYQPTKEYGRVGSTVAFHASADGRGQFSFQWMKNGVSIPGATSHKLVLVALTSADFGFYSVTVSSPFGFLSSESFELVPVEPIAPQIRRLALGNTHSLFLKGDATLWGMGSSAWGQLGNGTKIGSAVPVELMGGVLSIAAGDSHSLILKSDRSLWASGNNGYGQLGDGTTGDHVVPVKIADGVALVAAGSFHSLFVKSDGTLWAMGANYRGQLGDGTPDQRNVPVPIATGVIAVSAKREQSYFVRRDGTLWQMGNHWVSSDEVERNLPRQISAGVVDVAACGSGAVFLKGDGSMWVDGDGVGSYFGVDWTAHLPVKVAENVAKIAASAGHVLFVKTDGTLWATGGNGEGQLGDGTRDTRYAPIQISSGVIEVAASYENSAFIKQDGTVWLIGDNEYGQLGSGSQYGSWTPVQSATINELAIGVHPVSVSVTQGQSTTLSVSVAAFPAATYQWHKNGIAVFGATSPTLKIDNATPSHAGTYSVVVSNSTGSITSNGAYLNVTVRPDSPRLTNVSIRAFAGAGDDTLIVGFNIAGKGQKTVLIRGVGPKLLDYNVPSAVADPRITLYDDDVIIGTNDDWEASLAPVFADAGAFALDVGSKDAAMTATLGPGGYTIHLVNSGPVAEALVEVYDISRDAGTRLVNVSSRLRFRPGQLAILGTAVTGGPISVLARNVGPGLARYLPNGSSVLPDPHVRLYAGQTQIAVNDDWDPALLPFFGAAGAFTIDEGSKDAAIRAQFQAGGYTVHSTGNGGEGIAIIEIYESP